MNINVIELSSTNAISVVFEYDCDHAGAEVKSVEYSKDRWSVDAGRYVPDDSEELPTIVCRCGYKKLCEEDRD